MKRKEIMKAQVILFLFLFTFYSFSLLAYQGKNKGNQQDTITNHQRTEGEQHEHGSDTMEEGKPKAYGHPLFLLTSAYTESMAGYHRFSWCLLRE